MTTIDCPSCTRRLVLKPELVGRDLQCPGCGEPFTAHREAAENGAVGYVLHDTAEGELERLLRYARQEAQQHRRRRGAGCVGNAPAPAALLARPGVLSRPLSNRAVTATLLALFLAAVGVGGGLLVQGVIVHVTLRGLLFFFGGAFAALGGLGNWDWFMNHPRARPVVNWFGRSGARVIYVLLGLFLMSSIYWRSLLALPK